MRQPTNIQDIPRRTVTPQSDDYIELGGQNNGQSAMSMVDLRAWIMASVGSSIVNPVVATPATTTDFSMLPGKDAPISGVFFAPRDSSTLWTIAAGDTKWRIVNKDTP